MEIHIADGFGKSDFSVIKGVLKVKYKVAYVMQSVTNISTAGFVLLFFPSVDAAVI